jgi:hypothetical protein
MRDTVYGSEGWGSSLSESAGVSAARRAMKPADWRAAWRKKASGCTGPPCGAAFSAAPVLGRDLQL